jgi:predicted dehydrogenase
MLTLRGEFAVKTTKVGIVGVGNISGIYLQNLGKYKPVEVKAVADLDHSRAESAAAKHGVAACSVDELLADPEIEIVLNLTVPKAHFELNKRALLSGKSVHTEKPLTLSREQGRELVDIAKAKGLLVGAAPDTFLGAGLQTCRKLIDDGAIGEPVAAHAFMLCHGHESWHPSPEFYYEKGGGPMFDMGPYYLTALVSLIGPVKRVSGSARATFPTRTITSEPKKGKVIQVETPTHIVGVLDFANGAIGEITTSFDVWRSRLPCIEIYGTEGSLSVPDPNGFGGPVQICKRGSDWQDVALTHGYAENSRGLGVMDMAYAIRTGRTNRASGALAYHVVDIMQSILDASEAGRHIELTSGVDRPAPMDPANPEDELVG